VEGPCTVLRADRVIDGVSDSPLLEASVVIRGETIDTVGSTSELDVPAGAEVIDLGDRTVMPGLIDAHLHFLGVSDMWDDVLEDEAYRAARSVGDLRALLDAGFTTVRCLGSSIGPALARAVRERWLDGPRVVAAGQFICGTAGTWDHLRLPASVLAAQDLLVDGPDECRRAVRRRTRAGSEVIKIGISAGRRDDELHSWGDSPFEQVVTLSALEVRATVEEAERHGLMVAAHAIGDAAVRVALEAGVHTIEHGHAIEDRTLDTVVERQVPLVSTLAAMTYIGDRGSELGMPARVVDAAKRHSEEQRRSFDKAVRAGARIAAGSDFVGPPLHPHGENWVELVLMREAGMNEMAVLQAATKTAAEALGEERSIGTLEPGKRADLVVLDGDPLADLRAIQAVHLVFQGGLPVAGAAMASDAGRPAVAAPR
jgi:imidazolonepropionase-like amidohydrolase